jgi:hypothetical protein
MKRTPLLAVAAAALAVIAIRAVACGSWPRHEGELRQTASAHVSGLRRGAKANLEIAAAAHYVVHDADDIRETAIRSFSHQAVTLVDDAKHVTALDVDWKSDKHGVFEVPADLKDGDYTLHVEFDTALDHASVDLPVPLYTPARVHVITDRPLYEPGNTMRFRAVALRARDLVPLDGRPGRWIVTNPDGEVVLEDKAPAGDWGVVAGSFPLDRAAQVGTWHVAWISGDSRDDVTVKVEPFTLPRFRVDITADKPFYRPGDAPKLRGAVVYSSGAPVAGAQLTVDWTIAGGWPPPPEWQDTLLPKHAVAGPNGRFELALPVVPADLQGKATVTAEVSAVDVAGDRVASSATALLSEDGISATAVTELGDGLVDGFNNRLYVRVTTPDGHVVGGGKVHVRRAWQPDDRGSDAALDADGVASLQVDPGAPVNIEIPAAPWRRPKRTPSVTRTGAVDVASGQEASLADRLEMDRWNAALESCASLASSDGVAARVALRVDPAGAILAATGGNDDLDRCIAATIAGRHLTAADDRVYALEYRVADPPLPTLSVRVDAALDEPSGLADALRSLARHTRDCLPLDNTDGELPAALTWRATAGSRDVALGAWIDDRQGTVTAEGALACARTRLGTAARIHLTDPATTDAMGIVRLTVAQPPQLTSQKPQPTVMLGYELVVTAELPGEPTTKLRIAPGNVPSLRMRVDPVLAKPGQTVTAELIRGPTFEGELPKKLQLSCPTQHGEVDLDKESHRATMAIGETTSGWCEITGAGARALVYVQPAGKLAVSVTPGQDRYAPGQMAQLEVRTLVGDRGGPAAVGLFGVDDSLEQLVALPGAEDMARVQPKVETTTPAFGVLDGQALALGRIRGANAAAATVLRVSAIPPPPALDAEIDAHAQTTFDAIGELTDHFYTALAELHAQVRRWEATAPQSERMTPPTMAKLWNAALDACEARGEHVDDAFGRRLRLARLPSDLLSLTDPRAVVAVGTRLPEDVDNWASWVAKENP